MSTPPSAPVLFERMISRLRLRHLKLLVAIDQCGTVGHAAAEVGMTQPAATQMIKELEELLDVRLYERHSRGVMPTEVASLLVEQSRMVLGNMQHAADAMAAMAQGSDQPVHLGAIPAAIHRLLEPKMDALRVAMLSPVTVVEDSPDRVLALLNAGMIQMALVRRPVDRSTSRFVFTALAEDSIAVVASPGLRWRRGPTPLRELASFSWSAAPLSHSSGVAFDRACREAGFVPKRSHVQSIATGLLCKVVEAPNTLAAVPRTLATEMIRQGRLQEIVLDEEIALLPLGAMYMAEGLSVPCQTLLDTLGATDREPIEQSA